MKRIQTTAHTNEDGTLDLHLVTGLPKTEVDVVVEVSRKAERPSPERAPRRTLRELAGICADDPLVRGDQGEFEEREPLD